MHGVVFDHQRSALVGIASHVPGFMTAIRVAVLVLYALLAWERLGWSLWRGWIAKVEFETEALA